MTKTLEIRFTHNFDEATKLKDFGYEPIVRFWEGLGKTVKWWGL